MTTAKRQPVLSIPHGGGPCFFVEDPAGIWKGLEVFLRDLATSLPERPKAILIISGHWETQGFSVTGRARPSLIYDYRGFPPHTYELRYDVSGLPDLASDVAALLQKAGLTANVDYQRGLDHGVFVPLKVMFPEADIPVVALSLELQFNVAQHIAAGRALAPLRDRGVLIIGSGMSFHNLGAFGHPAAVEVSEEFDRWLTETVAMEPEARYLRLRDWITAPSARQCHPREEHLLPLMVAAGAADDRGHRNYGEHILGVAVSGYRFD